jgi:CDP-diglyceride synthetase
MQFWGITAGIGLNALLLGSLLELSDSFSGIFAVLATVFIIMIIIASILTYNYFQQKSNFEDDQNPTLGTWLANFVIVGIPIIGLIMLIVWATDSSKELIKKWAAARLIWIAISLMMVLYVYETYQLIKSISSYTYMQF